MGSKRHGDNMGDLEKKVISKEQFLDAMMEQIDCAESQYLELVKLLSRATECCEFQRTRYYAHVNDEGEVVELSYDRVPMIVGFNSGGR